MQPTYLSDFKTPGADLKGIYYLRNVVDADAIVAAIPKAKEKGGRVSHPLPCTPAPCKLLCSSLQFMQFWAVCGFLRQQQPIIPRNKVGRRCHTSSCVPW